MHLVENSDPPDLWDLVAALHSSSDQLGPFDPRTIGVANQLAVEFWRIGRIEQAISVLDQALDGLASTGSEHPVRLEVLCTLGQILIEQQRWDQARTILRQVVDSCIARSGATHPSSIAATGDLASVLFELGESAEAERLQTGAADLARVHLPREHPVSSVLSWNRLRRADEAGDANTARTILIDDLLWLLSANQADLDSDQLTIREMLALRTNWNASGSC